MVPKFFKWLQRALNHFSALEVRSVYVAILPLASVIQTNQEKQGISVDLSASIHYLFICTVPDTVWRLNIDVPEEARDISLDNAEDRWWDQTELTKLILASNLLTEISEDIVNFSALTVLDVGYLYYNNFMMLFKVL